MRGTSTFSEGPYSKDVNILFFTKDIPLGDVTGLQEPGKQLKVYPNPFSHYLYFGGMADTDATDVVLSDVTGKVIFNTRTDPHEPIDGSSLPTGIYVLQIRNGLNYFRQKVIKK